MRHLLGICLLLQLLGGLASPGSAAESDLQVAAASARQQAEAALAAERTRILTARSSRAAEVAALTRTLANQRAAMAAIENEIARLNRELATTQDGGAQTAAKVTQQLARAVAFLHIPAPSAVEPRAQAVAQALANAPAQLVDRAMLRTTQETIQDRSGLAVLVPVRRLGTARAWACGTTPDTRGLVIRQNGMDVIVGQPLPADLDTLLSDPEHLVLDVSGTWATQVPPPRRSFAQWIHGGRLFIWPIIVVGVIGLGMSFLRAMTFTKIHVDHRPLDAVYAWFSSGRQGSVPTCDTSHPVGRVLAVGLATLGQPRATREAALDRAVLAEAPPLMSGLSIILLLASIAPLLGLLGTVTGMIDLFAVIGAQGSGNARSLSGGISEALITTQAGMLVAVPLLVAHSLLNRAAERRLLLLDEAASGLLAQDDA